MPMKGVGAPPSSSSMPSLARFDTQIDASLKNPLRRRSVHLPRMTHSGMAPPPRQAVLPAAAAARGCDFAGIGSVVVPKSAGRRVCSSRGGIERNGRNADCMPLSMAERLTDKMTE